MNIKSYKVILKDGKSYPHLFYSVKDALKTVGATKIQKLQEVIEKVEVSETSIDRKAVAVIARRDNKEVDISDTTFQAATYNRPLLTKVFEGMTLLEVGEDVVLESKINSMGVFNNSLQSKYEPDISDGKEYQWVIYHIKGHKLTVEEARKKYKELETTTLKEGMVTYIRK